MISYKRYNNWRGPLSISCAVLAVMFSMSAAAQEAVRVKASVSANRSEKVKTFKDGGFKMTDVETKDTYKASATFVLDAAPADWQAYADDISVSVGGIDFSPDVKKSNAKGGSAKGTEKDKEWKSSISCSVKWSKNTITVSLSGSNYDEDNIIDVMDDEATIIEEVPIVVEMGDITCETTLAVRGTQQTKIKVVKSGKGKNADIEEFELVSWKVKGSYNGTPTDSPVAAKKETAPVPATTVVWRVK